MGAMAGLRAAAVLLGIVLLLAGCYIAAFQSSSNKHLQLSEEDRNKLLQNHRFVVLGGTHGSGASLLARLLSAHPSVSGMHGTDGIHDPYPVPLTFLLPDVRRTSGAVCIFWLDLAFGRRLSTDRDTYVWYHARSAQ